MKHFEVTFLAKGAAQGQSSGREDSVSGQPHFSDVLRVLEYLCDVSGAIRADKVVREIQFSERGVFLDGFADGDASTDHCLVVCQVQHQQVALIAEHSRNGIGALL